MLRTQRQRRILCRDCPIARVADLVGDSVSILILRDLLARPQRFTDMELAYQGVSSRTLSAKLKKLEKAELVKRVPNRRLGNRVNYKLTPKGTACAPLLKAMRNYGEKYL